jgi:hypothetical protein
MKKILCVVDSSPSIHHHIQFVGSLALDVEAKIILTSAQASRKSSLVASSRSNQEHLDEWHDYLSGILHVHSKIEPTDISSDPFQKLNLLGKSHDLITMSLTLENGKMRAAGLNLHRMLNEIQHPVLVVPNSITHWEVKRLIYAFDFRNDSPERLAQLGNLADWFKVGIKFYTLQSGDLSLQEQETRNLVFNKFLETRRGRNNVTFEPTAYPTKLSFDKNYKPGCEDLPVLTVQPLGLLDRLLGRDELTDAIQKNNSPYLVIHQPATAIKSE